MDIREKKIVLCTVALKTDPKNNKFFLQLSEQIVTHFRLKIVAFYYRKTDKVHLE